MKVPHICKSRFCPSCGKKATGIWIIHILNTLPKTG
ncbi:MAG: transposase zinc-binding domain-containing protein [Candidatus Brocadia sp.]|nr:transposase zinc-binding domain-containing protein [Candidatus Brocadia sp.]